MADNLVLNDGVTPAIVFLSLYAGDEFVFIYEEDITKNVSITDVATVSTQVFGAEPTENDHIQFPGYVPAHDVFTMLYLPTRLCGH